MWTTQKSEFFFLPARGTGLCACWSAHLRAVRKRTLTLIKCQGACLFFVSPSLLSPAVFLAVVVLMVNTATKGLAELPAQTAIQDALLSAAVIGAQTPRHGAATALLDLTVRELGLAL